MMEEKDWLNNDGRVPLLLSLLVHHRLPSLPPLPQARLPQRARRKMTHPCPLPLPAHVVMKLISI